MHDLAAAHWSGFLFAHMVRMKISPFPYTVALLGSVRVPDAGRLHCANHQLLIGDALITPEQLPQCQLWPVAPTDDSGDSPEPFVSGVESDSTEPISTWLITCSRASGFAVVA